MGDNKWTRTVLEEGDKQNFPKPGDNVAIHYTGWLYDPSQPENKGKKLVIIEAHEKSKNWP